MKRIRFEPRSESSAASIMPPSWLGGTSDWVQSPDGELHHDFRTRYWRARTVVRIRARWEGPILVVSARCWPEMFTLGIAMAAFFLLREPPRHPPTRWVLVVPAFILAVSVLVVRNFRFAVDEKLFELVMRLCPGPGLEPWEIIAGGTRPLRPPAASDGPLGLGEAVPPRSGTMVGFTLLLVPVIVLLGAIAKSAWLASSRFLFVLLATLTAFFVVVWIKAAEGLITGKGRRLFSTSTVGIVVGACAASIFAVLAAR
jgi:hypothetical protein